MSKRRKRKKKQIPKILSLLIIICAIIYSIYEEEINTSFALPNTNTTNKVSTNLTVTYLDVGQADSILIENNNQTMLIDAGNNEDGELLVKYFKEKGITQFNYLVATHPHEDHIGGMDNIINNFTINNIYMPDITTTTKTFLDVLNAIDSKNMTFKVPKIGETFTLGEATIEVIYTGNNKQDLNNTSIVLKLTFGTTSFLFTGDATSEVEKEILNKNIKADVLKVGHHGSKYSTTQEFLNKVNPKYAIISVGKNNSYDHPNEITLTKLKNKNIEIHRTDKEGTIIITSNGTNLTITNEQTNTNGG